MPKDGRLSVLFVEDIGHYFIIILCFASVDSLSGTGGVLKKRNGYIIRN
jgi:hypothetical protein